MSQIIDIPDLCGTWRRTLFQDEDGRRDVTSQVAWLQAQSAYGDFRQPPAVSGVTATSLRALTPADISILARQEGFGGHLIRRRDHFEWTRLIDYQPRRQQGDRGTLTWRDDLLIEEGYARPYIEHWRREGRPARAVSAARLADRDTGVAALLVCVDSRFAFLRDRAVRLEADRSLADLVAEANSLESMQDLVDCEVSLGFVDRWQIERSSLPWRVGASLAMRRSADALLTDDVDPTGAFTPRVWTICDEEER